ncbi:MAG: MarR family transcriptional regulator [Microbacterium sp.]|uniref:MarR family winged helix-turn-helix transcriptional regulator n=1 Tax=Microbacterium sp. TaxID=51671 RepID=UPI0039E71F72
MTRGEDIERLVIAAHALTRVAALRTQNEAPAAQWRALTVLRNEGAVRVGDLARASRTTQPGMTRLVGQLVEQGLVERGNDPEDSRATIVTITDAGAGALDAWREELRRALEPMFEGLSDEEWSALEHASRILTARASEPAGAAR